jgi:hypothetical protein
VFRVFFVDKVPLPDKERVINTKPVNDGLREWMSGRIIFVSGTNGRWSAFYTLAEFLAGEMFHRVRYAARDVTIRISCGNRIAKSCKGGKYTIVISIALPEGCRWGLFWNANYPEVVKLPDTLNDLNTEPTGNLGQGRANVRIMFQNIVVVRFKRVPQSTDIVG